MSPVLSEGKSQCGSVCVSSAVTAMEGRHGTAGKERLLMSPPMEEKKSGKTAVRTKASMGKFGPVTESEHSWTP